MNAIEILNKKIHSSKKFLYRNKVLQLKGFREHSGMFILFCIVNGKEEQIVKEDVYKLELFLNTLIEFDDIQMDKSEMTIDDNILPAKIPDSKFNKVNKILEKNNEAFQSLADVLMDDIKKVRADPSYVSQAKQVSNSAQTIINLVKLQLEIMIKG